MTPRQFIFEKQAVVITGAHGDLNGIFLRPSDSSPEVVIIMLSSGMQNRAGPQRLYWKFAQRAAAEGHGVLRVDLAGVGDSEAENNETHFDNHRKEDVNFIVEYAREQWPDSKLVLQGLCAGARVALKSAAINQDVGAVLAWSTEIYTASQNMPQSPLEPEGRMSDTAASEYIVKILRFVFTLKFLNPWWWAREYPDGEGLRHDINQSVRAIIHKISGKGNSDTGNEFLLSVDKYLRDERKIIFIFGELDKRPIDEFNQRYPLVTRSENSSQGYSVVPDGTHTYASIAAQEGVIQRSLDWIESQV